MNAETLQMAAQGEAKYVIVTQTGATLPELHAARELAEYLRRMTGAVFQVAHGDEDVPESAVVIGPGPLASRLFPEVDLASFAAEQLTIRTKGNRLLLAGGRPRGTLYAVYHFLQHQGGIRWWAPWAVHIPDAPDFSIGRLAIEDAPAFELRDVYNYAGSDRSFLVRNRCNGEGANGEGSGGPENGGGITYKGSNHTFFALVPPDEYFETRPDWFSLIDGKRTHPEGEKFRSQLCTTNAELRNFLADRVREWLRESPGADIVSISQEDTYPDWSGACECPDCKAIDEREGSHSGTIIELVNDIARKLGPEFPDVAFDTFAYRYTRKAPNTVKPLPNVIVRLCSIECNFAVPLGQPGNDDSFVTDMKEWSAICNRIYIWDYIVNFLHYMLPHPNWFALGPNVRFFREHNVSGVFAQGAYQSYGGEMAELRTWVLAQLLWNPDVDDRALIREFLEGYYGQAAAAHIGKYMEVMHASALAAGTYLSFASPADAAFLRFESLSEAERLWQQAEQAVQHEAALLWRVRLGHMAVRYAFLANWDDLRHQCEQAGGVWPLPDSRDTVADEWLAVAAGDGPAGWRPVTHLNESGLSPEAFRAGLA